MELINCSVIAFADSKKVEVSFDKHPKVILDISGDIDFTPLVEKLAELFPFAQEVAISPALVESDDKKTALVLTTIASFIEKYNLVQSPDNVKYDPEEDLF